MAENEKKTDLRVVKTKKAIRGALAELLSEKDMENITVKEIAERALINRKTFYNYYSGVYQVIDEIDDEIVSSFDAAIRGIDFKHDLQNPYVIYSRLTAVLNRDTAFYGYLLSSDRNTGLVSKVTKLLKAKAREALRGQVEIDDGKLEMVVDYTISGMVSVYQSWFKNGRKEPIEEISKLVSLIFAKGVAGITEMR